MPQTIIVFIFLVLATIFDHRIRKIPNLLVGVGLITAFSWHSFGHPGNWAFDHVSPGAVGLFGSIFAAVTMLLFFFPLYLLRVLGAGDVKLLAFVGGALGVRSEHWSHLVGVSLSVLVAGGLLALIRTFSGGRSALVFSNLRLIVAGWMLRTRGMPGPRFDPASDTADRLPYAYAITAGVSVYITAASSGIV